MQIEKGIPIPATHTNCDFPLLDEMNVGDSILFQLADWKRARNRAYIRKPKQCTFRAVKGGYRCWRIA